MSYDVLVIASDSPHVKYTHPADYQHLKARYGLTDDELDRLLTGKPPCWRVDGQEMIFPAIDIYFRNRRRLAIRPGDRERLVDGMDREACLTGLERYFTA